MNSNIKILIVEDEAIIALDLERALKKLGFTITSRATNYEDAMKSIKDNKPTLILMDICLEGSSKDGIETVEEIQKIYSIPILYLTSYSDDDTMDRAIQTNPIGYLIKPFKREELKSTIHLGLHKLNEQNNSKMDNDCMYLGSNYYYNLKLHQLYYKNIPVKLSSKESILLKVLIEADGNIVSFDSIEHHVWPERSISNSTLRTLVYRLRTKLEYKLIETIPSTGCKLTINK